jgi:hypothetical protein
LVHVRGHNSNKRTKYWGSEQYCSPWKQQRASKFEYSVAWPESQMLFDCLKKHKKKLSDFNYIESNSSK